MRTSALPVIGRQRPRLKFEQLGHIGRIVTTRDTVRPAVEPPVGPSGEARTRSRIAGSGSVAPYRCRIAEWGVPVCLWPRWSRGNPAVMSDGASVREPLGEGMRPCDFCGHPVVTDSVDEWDCPVCGEAAEDQQAEAGRGS
ncbi:hypothetical protein GCM10010515_56730 [Streptomyces fructofermentans]|uniref:Uncharacterized protein n=1 Tax=Streptomyces fructofermentans TaxID=152141 RepID=A0A918U1K5_9ACTN|nr:hypothetical protein GCM10010515_56730 [Streptomyces fructofermentans]